MLSLLLKTKQKIRVEKEMNSGLNHALEPRWRSVVIEKKKEEQDAVEAVDLLLYKNRP